MAINLVESIQTKLNYPPLQKIDPNTQEVKADDMKPDEDRFSQAAIPAILTGLFKYSTTDEGAENILRGDISTNWVSRIFGNTADEVIQKITSYTQIDSDQSGQMNKIAEEAVRIVRENINPEGTMMDVKNFMSSQPKTILLYLPEALHMGEFLQDTTLDDNTNKMEGPISSLMHKIGSAFSNPASEEEVNTKQ
ncbi:MAG: hypothetical protein WKI04_07830 [Ferruginibacter sp.]